MDWWPWCDEAFAEARERDVPVLLSVGYAACHWCHVMAHESFEDPGTAALLNEQVVAVKVDREERPDVDAVYMTATQAMTGQGGWPMTVFMTPDKEPFFCGTYFPRDYFGQLVLNISRAWRSQRDDVTDRAKQVAAALAENASATGRALREAGQSFQAEADARFGQAADAAVLALDRDYDTADGGFGGAPKFPPSMVLEFLLRYHQRTGSRGRAADGRGHLRGDGPRRHVRPARRRVRPVLRRCRLGGPALREDALRQRPAGSRLCELVAPDRLGAGPPGGRRDVRGDAAGAADRRRRPRRVAGRRQRRGGGKVLRLAAGRAAGDPRTRGRRVRGAGLRRDRGRHVLPRRLGAAAPGRTRGSGRRRALGPGPGRAAGRPRPPGPPGTGRQGGRRVERAGHFRAGRMRAAVRAAGLHRGRARRRQPVGHGAPGRRPARPHLAGRDRRGAPPGRSRTTPAPPRDSSRCPA